jgi:2'-5' RNA ligase
VTRAFVAVRLPDAVLDAIEQRVAGLSVPARITGREQWHLTLQFLGDAADVDAVTAALAGLDAAGGTARIGGAGAFPDARHGRVLWLGLIEGVALFGRIAAAVAECTAGLGHDVDPRPFRPHLTLARFRTATDLNSAIGRLGDDAVGPAWNVDAVTLFESRRESDGARYTARATAPLSA